MMEKISESHQVNEEQDPTKELQESSTVPENEDNILKTTLKDS